MILGDVGNFTSRHGVTSPKTSNVQRHRCDELKVSRLIKPVVPRHPIYRYRTLYSIRRVQYLCGSQSSVSFFSSFSENFEILRKATVTCFVSVCPHAWKNSAHTARILTKYDILAFFNNLPRKFEFH
jgi:hypothetical protein